VQGLLALMLLRARRDTRTDANGEIVTLEEQDRSRWDRERIAEGAGLAEQALRGGPPGEYAVQAAIARCATAPRRPTPIGGRSPRSTGCSRTSTRRRWSS
jgi:RNA polymerase sigma-70 factor (ECF subfamily)